MTRFTTAAAALAMAVTLAACAGSPTSPSGSSSSIGRTGTFTSGLAATGVDEGFIEFAERLHQLHIELGRIAQNQGDLSPVKFFAQQQIQEHTIALEQLRKSAGSDASASVSLTSAQTSSRTQLSGLSGSQLDRVYIPIVVQSYQEALTRFQREASNAGTSSMRAYAADRVQLLQAHLQQARDLAARIGVAV